MSYIAWKPTRPNARHIMLFAEGTILKPRSLLALYDHCAYLPIGQSVARVGEWISQGAEVAYCTSRRGPQAEALSNLLQSFGFAGAGLYYRDKGRRYADLVLEAAPDVLIEDDCRSIGGAWQMCITRVPEAYKRRITSIVVKEFGGIDQLPRQMAEL